MNKKILLTVASAFLVNAVNAVNLDEDESQEGHGAVAAVSIPSDCSLSEKEYKAVLGAVMSIMEQRQEDIWLEKIYAEGDSSVRFQTTDGFKYFLNLGNTEITLSGPDGNWLVAPGKHLCLGK